jgi:predicted amidophosphoribosyltransferase
VKLPAVTARRLLALLAPPLCAACGAAAGDAEPLCGSCRRALRWLGPRPAELAGVRVWAPVAYEGPARDLVRALKFGGAWRAAETMAAQIAANASPELLGDRPGRFDARYTGLRSTSCSAEGAPALVPVPLHPRRRRRRGYDQAALLARALGERTGIPVCACLERAGSAGAQVGRGRSERLAGPPGEVRLRAGSTVPPHALLVDDVATTGGTLAACAAVLRAAGCAELAALAYARTPGR